MTTIPSALPPSPDSAQPRPMQRKRYMLGLLLALAFGSIAALQASYGAAFMPQAVLMIWAVLLLAAVIVFRPKS